MDARGLAFELAPFLLWKKEESRNRNTLGRSATFQSASFGSRDGTTNGESLTRSPSISVTFVNVKDARRDWEGKLDFIFY